MPNKRQGKWLPFDSLEGHRKSLKEAEEELEKEEAPSLSIDEIEEINNLIITAFKENVKVRMKIFKNGKKNSIDGYINKIDTIHKYIVLNKEKVDMILIIGVEMCTL